MIFRRNSMSTKQSTTPFPWRQLIILSLCRICEPIAFMSIFPYSYFMLKSFNVDERYLGWYVGLVTAAFAFAECLAGPFWGRLSDRIGRKPVLLTGLLGTGISMLLFGFATNLWTALIARAVGGLLNGNIGVLTTTVAEVVTVEAHQPRAFAIMPFVWCLGTIVAGVLGGTLAEPVKSYPGYFKAGGLFDRYPYLLPNLVCTGVVIFSFNVGLFFLGETHEDKLNRKDVCLSVGNRFLALFSVNVKLPCEEEPQALDEKDEKDERCMGYSANSRFLPNISAPCSAQSSVIGNGCKDIKNPSWLKGFTRQVLYVVVSVGFLAFHTITFEQLMPVLFSMPESTTRPELPFKFVGGFALSTTTIGIILSCQGVLQMLAQIFLFEAVSARLGSLMTFRIVAFGYPLLYFCVPYLALLPTTLRGLGIFLVLVCKVTGQALSYPSLNIMLANATDKRVLGTVMGVSSSAASLARALGPMLAGLIQAEGLKIGYSGFSWWWCSIVSVVGVVVSLKLEDTGSRNKSRNKSRWQRSGDGSDEEEALLPENYEYGSLASRLVPDAGSTIGDDAESCVSTLVGDEDNHTATEAGSKC
ncbi:MFS general substrate transporter [Trichodelitschia bisporula]|uniref:MFS general substrate transporter n=1 Tax=Trichodelitschia bisporula TaxID=703511 RepID=A0A6G1I769_9PEZI|nr:MFS general substrate transporter [Trichodelitschia bisporula]